LDIGFSVIYISNTSPGYIIVYLEVLCYLSQKI